MDARRPYQPYGARWPPRVDARDLVVKVKYGDTLKRFNASVNGSHFDHDLPALRLKIASAFKFSSDTEFILTYTDEDEDDVMLDDDSDLRDAAVNQKLNPLRIIVQLKVSNVGAAWTKQHTTNFKSPRSTSLEDQLALVKLAIDKALKFAPEHIPAVFATLSHDLRAIAALSTPRLAELLNCFAKLIARISNMQPSGGSGVSSQNLGNSKLESASMALSASEPSHMQDSGTPENGLKSVLLENPTPKIDQVPLCPSVEDSLVFTSLGGMKSELKRSADNEIKVKSDASSKGKSVISSVLPASTTSHGAPTQRPVPVPSMRENKLIYGTNPAYTSCGSNGTINGGVHSLFPPPPVVFHHRSPVFPPYNPIFGTNGKTVGDMLSTFSPPPNIYPFEHTPSSVGTRFPNLYPIGSSHDRMASLHYNVPNPEDKSFGSSYRGPGANYGSIPQLEQHRWVQCDGCGVTPIVGPRYKSNVKEDYDLCGACFSHIGNEAEYKYTRLDSSASRCNLKILERVPAAKTNSLFIKDVTVPDGTPMAPLHPFTKIWRVCNNGPTRWPYGTQLVWIGGDHLTSPSSVRLAISVNGRINPFEETDVAVDFLAPPRPGRYISYWRLALPSGQRFGQRIWVHIKVEEPIPSSGVKQAAAMNLNQLPEANSTKLKPFTIDLETNSVSSEPFYGCPGIPQANSTKLKPSTLDLETNSVSSEPFSRCPGSFRKTMKLEESKPAPGDMSFVPTVEPVQNCVTDVFSAHSFLAAIHAGVPASEAFPLPNPVPMLPVSSSAPVVDLVSMRAPAATISPVPAAPLPEQIIDHLEQKLITELEGLGFMQADLNKQILRQNNYNLEQSVAHLCDYDEWDALEFSELGFDDAEMNKEVVDNSDEEGPIVADLVTKAANEH